MINTMKLFVVIAFLMIFNSIGAQDTSKLYFTTGIGLIKVQGELSKVFKSSVAFNSGVEIKFGHNWYGLAEAGFNSLGYNQQVRDNNSAFLFQNTSSSLFLLGINAGKDFHFGNPGWFVSVYGGGGYLTIGEPRITLDNTTGIVRQQAVRKNSVFGKAGSRLGYLTRSKFFQTIYLDGSWWVSPAAIQDHKLNSLSFFIGTRMAIGN